MTALLCRVSGAIETVRDLLESSGAEIPCRPVAVRGTDGVTVQVILTDAAVDRVRGARADVEIEILHDLDANAAAARRDLSEGDRYAARDAVPHGIGRKE